MQPTPLQPTLATPDLRRRQLCLLAAGAVTGLSQAKPAPLALSAALSAELGQALQRGQPLLVLVSLEGCGLCRLVRENYLAPMRQSQGLHAVELEMQGRHSLQDFKGAGLSHAEQVQLWGVKVAPTVLFFGRAGLEVAERLVGLVSTDFYGAYLEGRIQQAQAKVR